MAEQWAHQGDAGENTGDAGFQAAEDVGFGDREGDVGEVHTGEDGDAERADDASAISSQSETNDPTPASDLQYPQAKNSS